MSVDRDLSAVVVERLLDVKRPEKPRNSDKQTLLYKKRDRKSSASVTPAIFGSERRTGQTLPTANATAKAKCTVALTLRVR